MSLKTIFYKIFNKKTNKNNNLWDYYLAKVNRKDKERLNYLAAETQIIIHYSSTDEEINNWLNMLYLLSNDEIYRERGIINSHIEDFNNKSEILKKKIIKKEVYIGDLYIFTHIAGIYEYYPFKYNDILDELIEKIYYKLDKIVHPYYEKKDIDLEDIRYYSELEYIDDIKD